jgi:carbonic anhydrase
MLLNRRYDYKNKVLGLYDHETEKNVKNFQARNELPSTGVVDTKTWNKLIGEPPAVYAMWPLEESYQPFPDEQLYYARNRGETESKNCRLYGTYHWSTDVPGVTSNKTQGGITSTNWKDKNGAVKKDKRSLYFEFKGVYRGGYAECNELKGFDEGARALTVEMFFKPSSIAQRAALFSSCDKKMNGFYLGYRGYFMRVGISAQSYLDVPVRFFDETWHHVAGVFDGNQGNNGRLTVFLDGKKIGEKSVAEKSIPWRSKKARKAPLMGAFSGNSRIRHFWGKIDNVRISFNPLNASSLLMRGEEVLKMNNKTNFFVDKPEIASKLKFAYSGPKGTGSWGNMSKLCSTGEQQSPVNLPSPVPDKTLSGSGNPAMPAAHLKYIEMAYHKTTPKSYLNGTQYGFTLGNNAGELLLNDERLVAKRVTFHTPSEHTVGGMPSEMEMQVEHFEKSTAKRVIVSILFQKGRVNHVIGPVLQKMAEMKTKKSGETLASFSLLDIIPYDPGFVIYDGSLTRPPCSEGVRWIVMDKANTASPEQIEGIKQVVGDNARPQQNLNGRAVKRITSGAPLLAELVAAQELITAEERQ